MHRLRSTECSESELLAERHAAGLTASCFLAVIHHELEASHRRRGLVLRGDRRGGKEGPKNIERLRLPVLDERPPACCDNNWSNRSMKPPSNAKSWPGTHLGFQPRDSFCGLYCLPSTQCEALQQLRELTQQAEQSTRQAEEAAEQADFPRLSHVVYR